MKPGYRTGCGVFIASFLSLILCIVALFANWFEFRVSWNPNKIISGYEGKSITFEGVGLFNRPRLDTQACYTTGDCGFSNYVSYPRLHNNPLSLPQAAGMLQVTIAALAICALVALVDLVFLSLAGWKTVAAFSITALFGLILYALLGPAIYLSMGGDALPDWNSCPASVEVISCTIHGEGCVANTSGSCSFQAIDHGLTLSVIGSADWLYSGVAIPGPLLLAAAFLLAGAAVRSLLPEQRPPGSSPAPPVMAHTLQNW